MRLRLSLLLCLFWIIMTIGISHAYGDQRADVRVIHAVSDAGAVEVYLNESFTGQVDFGRAAQFISVPEGNITLRLFAPGSDPAGEPLFTGEFAARDGQVLNAVLMGTGDALQVSAFPVDRTPLELGKSRVNIIHAAAGADALDMGAAPADGERIALAEQLAYAASAQSEVAAGSYSFDFQGTSFDQQYNFMAGTSYSIVLANETDGGAPVRPLIFANATTLDVPAGNLRFVNVAMSPLTVTVNDIFVANLPATGSTVYLALAAGSYDIAVYGADAAPLLEHSVELAENDWKTAVINGAPRPSSLTLFTDDLSIPAAGEARFTVANVRADALNFTVDGEVALEALASGGAASLTLTTEAHTLDLLVGGSSYYTLEDYRVLPDSPFSLRTLIVGDGGVALLAACAVP
ncbi:MAG: DUF4397 domain-containing protein [Anaerolineae bacterium]